MRGPLLSAHRPDVQARRTPLRRMSLVVLLVVAATAVASFLFTRHVVADQEHRLLNQRTDEAALYLSSLVNSIQSEFASLSGAASATSASPAAFERSTKLLTAAPGGFATIALVR